MRCRSGRCAGAGDGGRRAVVVDTGPEPEPVDRCLRRLRIRRIALLVVSHLHADHAGGIRGVLTGARSRWSWSGRVLPVTTRRVCSTRRPGSVSWCGKRVPVRPCVRAISTSGCWARPGDGQAVPRTTTRSSWRSTPSWAGSCCRETRRRPRSTHSCGRAPTCVRTC
ncbi:MBL fold metallo-hydrolase [Rhodococcus pyridinivorans]|uniref:MBL fold metallo-hydrolase n=1 Tax=Rhodococcus pyridinivorans TaxID=103816 RepID=UPI0020167A11|nr:MBL fold metallo-hydrolase [Rhodococcus pyridinivorans]